ncbi:SRPBCC family protein [Zhihengliuella salsuginis]|uniref:Activator of Hsp90 ATPase homologue 1/2-like C-terminal domain-containing protein n=1 Tax=Zhihengliuella salsuginis TaxID=578222 RepID=A0ABQ3GHB0_9MICC|nr:SRPBCC family protein [Zhihengliuella salsuginis]GHD04995.1 hypothetical protein GCM10008096_13190 [Zhihengliuella salsuginis]
MPITTVDRDLHDLTLTVVADFAAPVQRLWDAYRDPRQLEKFWGPPSYPATFTRHDAYPGGLTTYYMTGPEGDAHGGYWEWLAVDAPNSFEVLDGFLTDAGEPNLELPRVRMTFTFEATDAGSRMTTTSHFASQADLEQLLGMGMEQGMREAMGQIDDVLADLEAFAAGRATDAQILSDTQVRISRVVRGDVEQVWRAHNNADLMKRWMLGPDGWSMPVCEVASAVGETYRYEWENIDDDQERFGFTGELLEAEAPHRMVTTEAMIGNEGTATRNEMTLTPVEAGTLISLLITYPDAETRDMILATGMTDGMETSYARLEEAVLAG